MDFVTQVTLGAAVGQAVMHRDLGIKAVLWGMLIGALPDLDVLANPLLDPVTQLTWHRGISHSILLTLVLTPLLGWLIARVHQGQITVEKSALFVFLALGTHILIDLFTTYGTQVFAPFSDYPASFNTLFIIDPLYTLPLLIFLLLSLLPGETRAKLFRNAIGIILSSAYVLVALLFKFSMLSSFERELERQHIPVQRMITTATPFNTMLWRCMAETSDGYYIGYRSIFDSHHDVLFWFVPRNEQLLEPFEGQRALETLKWFSDGWYSVEKDEHGLHFHDLRFGEFDTVDPERNFGLKNPLNLEYVFSFRFIDTGPPDSPDRYTIEKADFRISEAGDIINVLWGRIKGTDRRIAAPQ
ncbi:MAG: metal-dependent hydrolase [Bacteroidota bacterium]|jgi:inner membrane protein